MAHPILVIASALHEPDPWGCATAIARRIAARAGRVLCLDLSPGTHDLHRRLAASGAPAGLEEVLSGGSSYHLQLRTAAADPRIQVLTYRGGAGYLLGTAPFLRLCKQAAREFSHVLITCALDQGPWVGEIAVWSHGFVLVSPPDRPATSRALQPVSAASAPLLLVAAGAERPAAEALATRLGAALVGILADTGPEAAATLELAADLAMGARSAALPSVTERKDHPTGPLTVTKGKQPALRAARRRSGASPPLAALEQEIQALRKRLAELETLYQQRLSVAAAKERQPEVHE